MKTLVLTSTHFAYEGCDFSVDAAYLVPDDFDAQWDRRLFFDRLQAAKDTRIRWTKEGHPHGADHGKVERIWRVDLTTRFTKVDTIHYDYEP